MANQIMKERQTMAQEFTVAQEIATFLASSELLPKAWKELLRACENSPQSFTLSEDEDVVYVAFPSFHRLEDFIVKEGKYGQATIPTGNKIFSGCLKGNDGQPARVHQGALKLFLHIMENTNLEEKLQIYMELKPVVFIGHFLGGSVAILATLWALGKRLKQSSPFCVTFGCPLVGDARLVEAVDRQNWAGNFCRVVSQHDIVPRILLAPFESITVPLSKLLPYWRGIMTKVIKYASDYIIRDAYTALLHYISGLDGVIGGSPYRPFGVYMFCSSHRAVCIINSETILKMLHLTLQGQENSSDRNVQEHINYGTVLKNVIRNPGRISSSNTESSYEMGISLQLKAIGVEAQEGVAVEIAEAVVGALKSELAATAVNAPMVPAEVLSELAPFITLAEKLGRLAVQLVAGGSGVKSVKVTYSSARAGDDLDTRVLRAMITKGIIEPISSAFVNLVNADFIARQRGLRISEERVLFDGSPQEPLESIQVQIADVESKFASAISESGYIKVEGKVKDGIPHLSKVGAFSVEVSLEGSVILCRQTDQPGMIGTVGNILGEENVNVNFMSVGRIVGESSMFWNFHG